MRALPFPLVVLLALTACGDAKPAAVQEWTDVDQVAFPISTILKRVDGNQSEGAARSEAWDLWRSIAIDGLDFAQVARQNTDDATRSVGGFAGFVPTDLETRAAGAIQALRPGEVSPPIRTGLGYQIFKRHTFEEGSR